MSITLIYVYTCESCGEAASVSEANVGLYGDNYPVLLPGWTEGEKLLCPACSLAAKQPATLEYHVDYDGPGVLRIKFRSQGPVGAEVSADFAHVLDGFVNYLACAGIGAKRVYTWGSK